MNKIELIRDDIVINAKKSGEQMKERYNRKVNPLCLTIGDFVYLLKEPIGPVKSLNQNIPAPLLFIGCRQTTW
jgi:hypothetical protein